MATKNAKTGPQVANHNKKNSKSEPIRNPTGLKSGFRMVWFWNSQAYLELCSRPFVGKEITFIGCSFGATIVKINLHYCDHSDDLNIKQKVHQLNGLAI